MFPEYDLLLFVETFLEQKDNPPNIPDYRSINLFANKENSGGRARKGLSIYYKNEFKFGRKLQTIELNDFCLIQEFENLVIAVCYFHNDEYSLTDFVENLDNIFIWLRNFTHKAILLTGDFNCNINKNKHCKKTEYLLQKTMQNGLSLANNPIMLTYGHLNHLGSTIDLIFHNTNINLTDFKVKSHIEIKHHPVSSTFILKNSSNIITPTQSTRKAKVFHKIDLERLQFLVNNDYVLMSNLLHNENIEAFYLHVIDIIQQSRQAPRKSNRKSKPWFDSDCFLSRKYLIELYHTLIVCNFQNQIIMSNFCEQQKIYKRLLKSKRNDFNLRKENELILQAEEEAYLFLNRPIEIHDKVQNPIDMEEWVQHMSKILNKENLNNNDSLNLKSLLIDYDEDIITNPILDDEILFAARHLKNKKAPGPDMITNENVKSLITFMLPLINTFFNKCLTTGTLPRQCKYSKMKLLYKNKGKITDCNSYRGICLSNTLCKLLDKILANRILSHFHDIIPREQYGFMPGRSTILAAKHFHQKLTTAITTKGTKKYAIFIDLTKAFDLTDRKILFNKIKAKKKMSKTELNLLAEFLQCDLISIDDGISQSEPFVQSNGVKQGMNSSPLLFNIYIHDIIKIFEGIEGVEFFFYADDMVFLCESLDLLNKVMQKFMLYAAKNFLQPNFSKTKLMKFTINGLGKYSAEELNFSVAGEKIDFVKSFPYLGIHFQRDCRNFTAHIVQRKNNSILAMNMYGDLRKLSVDCAKKLFKIKFAPMASYGIEVIWPFLSVKDFKELERVKSRYLKRVLGVHKKNKNTYVYRLAEEALFVEELKTQYNLPPTENYDKFLTGYKSEHETRFNAKFLDTPAMRNDVWKQPLFEKDRHVFTRYAIHGFHNQICNQTSDKKQCFIESDQCVCILCGEKCTQYHLNECNKRVQSLNVYATSIKN